MMKNRWRCRYRHGCCTTRRRYHWNCQCCSAWM